MHVKGKASVNCATPATKSKLNVKLVDPLLVYIVVVHDSST